MDSLSIAWDYLQVIAYPACFLAGVFWASRPKEIYLEDGGWRTEERPAFCQTKEIEE